MAAKKKTKSMSDAHKAALAEGREQGRAVRSYLEALEVSRPKRGRRRTPESIQKRLTVIEESIGAADPVTRLTLIQERRDLTAELETLGPDADLDAREAAFVAAAAGYSERKGIAYSTWREVGVPASVLKAAGITRAS